MVDPIVSVIIPVYNGAEVIERQLGALHAQSGCPPFELVVADNGSTDSTADIVRRWANAKHPGITDVVLVDASKRRGPAHARNAGAMASSGVVLAFCDADDRVPPHWLRSLLQHVGDGMVAGGIEPSVPEGQKHKDFRDGLMSSPYLPFASSANFAITRRAFFSSGGFDESFPRYGAEDLEFSWRVQENGFPLAYAPDTFLDYTVSTGREVVRKVFLMEVGRMAALARHPLATASNPITLARVAKEAGSHLIRLPWKLLSPGPAGRAREVRTALSSLGTLAGYLKYHVRGHRHQPLLIASHPGISTTRG